MYQYLANTEIELYDLLTNIGGVFLLSFNLKHLKQKKLILGNCSHLLIRSFSKKNRIPWLSSVTFWSILEIIFISFIQYLLPFSPSFGKLVGTGVNYFGLLYFTPFVLMLCCYLLSIDPIKQFDLITPAYPLGLIPTKIGCFCAGCCNGIKWSFGLYNHETGRVEFPVQLVEAGLALLIFIFLLLYKKKAKEGTLFPVYLIVYSATRFFSEFLSGKPDIIWRLKTYHILCIIGVVVGIIELLVVLKYGEKIKEMFASNFIIKRMEKKIEEKKEKEKMIPHKYKKR